MYPEKWEDWSCTRISYIMWINHGSVIQPITSGNKSQSGNHFCSGHDGWRLGLDGLFPPISGPAAEWRPRVVTSSAIVVRLQRTPAFHDIREETDKWFGLLQIQRAGWGCQDVGQSSRPFMRYTMAVTYNDMQICVRPLSYVVRS